MGLPDRVGVVGVVFHAANLRGGGAGTVKVKGTVQRGTSMAAGSLVSTVCFLTALAAESAWSAAAAPDDFADMTNINVWQCDNSTGQRWYRNSNVANCAWYPAIPL